MKDKKLTPKIIDTIKGKLDECVPQKEIAEMFGVSQSVVSRIKTGKDYVYEPPLVIKGLSKKTKQILKNIAANKGVLSANGLIRSEILKYIDNTPEHLKRPPLDY